MKLGLKNKTVVVTGGSQGIGLAIAEAFLEEGCHVVISGRNPERLAQALETLKKTAAEPDFAEGCPLDGSDEEQTFELADLAARRTGKIDVWVNNVGTNRRRKGELYTNEEVDFLVGAIFKSAVFGSQAAFRHMKEHGGSIVNIASLAARSATCGRSTLYGALKSAVVGLTRTTAGEYAAYGIRVNAVMPGYTATPLVLNTFAKADLDALLQNNLLRRMAQPSEIAQPVVFLASDAASYITAATLEVSGGHSVVLNPEESYLQKAQEKCR